MFCQTYTKCRTFNVDLIWCVRSNDFTCSMFWFDFEIVLTMCYALYFILLLNFSFTDIPERVVPIIISLISDCSIPSKLLNHRFLLVKLKPSLQKCYSHQHDAVDRYGISVAQNDHGYVPFVVIIICSHSWLITGLVTRLTRRVLQVEHCLSFLRLAIILSVLPE